MAAGRAFRYSPRPKVVSAIALAGASYRQPCRCKPQATLVLRAATPIPAACNLALHNLPVYLNLKYHQLTLIPHPIQITLAFFNTTLTNYHKLRYITTFHTSFFVLCYCQFVSIFIPEKKCRYVQSS